MYNSLQLSGEKRMSHNLTLIGNYTWSKSTDTLPVDASPGGPADGNSWVYPWYFPHADSLDRGLSDFDHAQRFVVSYVYQLPLFSKSNAFIRTVAGGWQFTGVFQAQTGPPLTVVAGKDQSLTALGRDRAVLTGAPYGGNACGTTAPCVNYLDPNSFALPATGAFGNVGKGLLRGPGLQVWDTGLFKNFPIKERLNIQFRAEFFNVLNRANFTGPAGSCNATSCDSTRATVNAGGFGSIRAAADPRIGQLALKLTF